MTATTVKQVLFKSEPHGWVKPSDMEVTTTSLDLTLTENDILVKLLYISVDPYMRGMMRVNTASYRSGFSLNAPMSGGCIAQVLESRHPKFPVNTLLLGSMSWQDVQVIPAASTAMLMPVTASPDFPLSFFLGIAGMPGFTAYAGLLGIGKPVKGETLYVSAASGAVGLVVCQIGKALGLRVVGSAGTDEKVEYLRDVIKVDEAFNYKTVENLEETLGKACPAGIDIYFENVGGEMLDVVLGKMNVNGRIPVCGMISQYNTTSETAYGVKNLMQVIGKRLVFQGFIISDSYGKPIHGEFMRDILKWIKEGSIVYKETVTEGIENTPDAFVGMLKGENFGKAVVKVADAVV